MATMNHIIRPANVEDVIQLVDIENKCFASNKFFVYSPEHFKYVIKKAKADLLVVADGNNTIYGYLLQLYRSGSSSAHLYSIAVDPQHQRHGAGRKLFAEGERVAIARNCRSVILEVRADSDALINMYSCFGYQKNKILNEHYPDKTHGVRMKKVLVAS